MRYLDNEIYLNNVKTAIKHTIGFEDFYKKKMLILGASGLIGSFIVDCFIYANKMWDAGIAIYVVSRNRERLKTRFGDEGREYLKFIEADVTTMDIEMAFDYIIHAASYGHPKAFREIPVEVLLSNVIGVHKALEIAKLNIDCRVLYVSSGEAQEQLDHLSVRACYPLGKKAAETLCISYCEEYGVNVVIARPCHTFGANVTENDNRATAQFLEAAAKGENIKMYSRGEQVRSFAYVADCVSGLLTVLARGKTGFVYGISLDENCSVKEFADKCAVAGKCKLEMHLPDYIEKAEMSPIGNQIVDNRWVKALGWHPVFSIDEGIRNTVEIMRGGI